MSFDNYLLEQLMTLIGAAKEYGIEFIYAISPGLDITFSNQKEVSALKRKLDQVLYHCLLLKYEPCFKVHDTYLCVVLQSCFISFTTPQVSHFGCKSFALLFDDIDHNMCPADKEVFSSFAHAQVSITNEIYQYLGEPEAFLFCPTGTHNLHQNPVCILNICFTIKSCICLSF